MTTGVENRDSNGPLPFLAAATTLKAREAGMAEIANLCLYIQDATAAPAHAPVAPSGPKAPSTLAGAQSLAGNKHATLALHVPIVTVLFFAPRNGSNADARAAPWVREVLDSPTSGDARFSYPPQARDAALWAEKIAPIMDITFIDLRCVFPGPNYRTTCSSFDYGTIAFSLRSACANRVFCAARRC